MPGDCLLVLDDYHSLESPAVDQALAFMLDHLPPQLHLVIATRENPQLPLARLRARGHLTELRAADLRFTPQEAAEFLNRVMGLALAPEDVAALESRTEGWIAGLQLAALSLQGRADRAEFIRAFTGSHRFVLDYLVEEVLARQPQPVRDFLLKTAILGRLNGDLCDAVLQQPGSQAMLEALEQGNLFLVALDDKRHWYRYHHLFGAALHNDLQRQHPAALHALHLRASRWFAQHDLPYEAIHHALAAPDFEHAADLLERVWLGMDEFYQTPTWLAWARALPEQVILNRPILCLGYGRSLAYAGQLELADAWLRVAERWLHAPEGDQATMRVAEARLFAWLPAMLQCSWTYNALARGDIPATLAHAQHALRVWPKTTC
ncbi:MAG: hypothetical protein HC915_01320 [Anaerolineae bacterium]|nr:hypothetical protein [Anaerolineae bacterium]